MRPGATPDLVMRLLPEALRREVKSTDIDTALADSLYSGYIEKQKLATERVNHHDSLRVPEGFHFNSISGLSNEMIERLERAQPRNKRSYSSRTFDSFGPSDCRGHQQVTDK
jgi:tRNA uridine 5-carboxymethylaminomethyl modification enzyme